MHTIYKLISPSGKCYIGQTNKTANVRFKQHVTAWKRNTSRQGIPSKLFNAFTKYEPESWTLEVLEENIETDAIDKKEQAYIEQFDTTSNGYNISRGGGSKKSSSNELQHNQRISESRKAFFQTPDGVEWKSQLRVRMIEYNTSRLGKPGHKHSRETVEQIRAKNIGQKRTDDVKKKHSLQMKKRWADGVFANRPKRTKEQMLACGCTMLGKKQSAQQKSKVSVALSKTYTVRFPDGSVHTVINLCEFARNHGLDQGNLSRTLGCNSTHKGYTVLSLI